MRAISKIGVFVIVSCLCGCAGAGLKTAQDTIDWEHANPLFTVAGVFDRAKTASADAGSFVYVSYDASAAGMKKIYDKIRSQSKGKIDLHLYGPDSFLAEADDSILLFTAAGAIRAEKTVPPDLGPEFARVLEQDERFGSNLTLYGDGRKKDSPVAKRHKFRFADCMCYLQVEEDGQRCAKMPWFASPRCRMFMNAYARYQERLFSSPVLVVLSRFSENEQNGYDGAVKNMLGGNMVISSLNSLAALWKRRMAEPAGQTWFVDIVYAADGTAKAIVASENMRAAEMESVRILKGIGEREAFVSYDEAWENNGAKYKKINPGLYDWWHDINLMMTLGAMSAPDEIYEALVAQKGSATAEEVSYHVKPLLAERFGPGYRVKEIK